MNEICANCGREKSTHEYEHMDGPDSPTTFACLFELNDTDSKPSGRVSVPVEFIEAVRALEDIWYGKEFASKTLNKCIKTQNEVWESLRAMLDQIDGKE